MKLRFSFTYIAAVAMAVLATGCASVAVTDQAMADKTAFSLGLEKNEFTISDRRDDGFQTYYTVRTKDGKRYNCYVAGGFTVAGRMVSDAVCNEAGKAAKKPGAGNEPSCNALLKATGRC